MAIKPKLESISEKASCGIEDVVYINAVFKAGAYVNLSEILGSFINKGLKESFGTPPDS